jgi:hypothetical protein
MALPQVISILGNGGLNINTNTYAVSGLVMPGVPTAGVPNITPIEIRSVKQAEFLGINAAYDNTNNLLCYHHISEFFRMCPSGTLWFMLVPVATTQTSIATPTNTTFAKKLLQAANGKIKQLAIAGGGAVGALSGGLESDVLTAIPQAQALANSEWSEFRPMPAILLEGRGFNGTAAAATNLTTLNARNVSVVIGQDAAIAALKTQYNRYAAVGTALGSVATANVYESIKHVARLNIASNRYSRFLTPALSSQVALTGYTAADLDTLHDKGYIFGRTFAGYPGVYWSSSKTCTVSTNDYYLIERNRAMYKVIDVARTALLPHIGEARIVDSNGRLNSKDRAMLETEVRAAIQLGAGNDIVKLVSVVIDPAANENNIPYPAYNTDQTLRVYIKIVPFLGTDMIELSATFTL